MHSYPRPPEWPYNVFSVDLRPDQKAIITVPKRSIAKTETVLLAFMRGRSDSACVGSLTFRFWRGAVFIGSETVPVRLCSAEAPSEKWVLVRAGGPYYWLMRYCFTKISEKLFAGMSIIHSRVNECFSASGRRSFSRSRMPHSGLRLFKLRSKASLDGAV